MFEITIEVRDRRVLEYYAYLLERIPQTTREVVKEIVILHRDRIRHLLARKPDHPHYPFQWTTIRQKQAFFATNGFGGGIPYQRTGAIENGWEVFAEPSDAGAAIHTRNAAPGIQYVEGFRQQPGHVVSGWLYAPDVIIEAENRLADDFANEMRSLFREVRSIR